MKNDTMKKLPTVVTTSWDDGHKLDFKLAALLLKYNIKGTFYIAPNDRESPEGDRLTRDEIRTLGETMEIGAHTMSHPQLPTLPDDEARKEIADSKVYLEEITGTPVVSFCYPRGEYEQKHVAMVRESGFRLARTVNRFAFDTGRDIFEMPTTIHTYDHYLDVFGVLNFVKWNPILFFRYYRKWDVLAKAMFDRALLTGGVFHLWGHSWEVEGHNDWQRLEDVLAYISNRKDVQYLTNGALS